MSVGAVNKQTGERIPTAGIPAVDSVLSSVSTNPVQNRVVKAALDEKADTDMVAADFNAGTSYTAGNYCVQDGKLYKFKNNHSGAWSSADVDEVKITGELSSLKRGLTKHAITFIANTGYTIEDQGSYVIGNVAYLNFFIKSETRITSRVNVGNMSVGMPSGKVVSITCPSAYVIDSVLNGYANVMIGVASASTITVGDYITQEGGCSQINVNCAVVIS